MLDLLIITGASKGIGNSIATKCSTIADKILGISSSEKIFDLNLENKNCKYLPLKLDLSDYNNVQKTIEKELEKINPKNIGIVLSGASLGEYGGLFSDDLSNWDKLYKCNVLGNLAVIKACHNQLKNGILCNIAFFAGGGACNYYTDFSGYALSKAATARAVENIAEEFKKLNYNASIIAVSPGAVETDMFHKIMDHGGTVKTRTKIEEPTNFIYKFLNNEFDNKSINGRILHVRDDINNMNFNSEDMCKLRRII
jgi:NADP-dependent 3-hydroxy acid dehydrogenase YdfG